MSILDDLHYDAAGLVPVVLQDVGTREVLTLAYTDREGVERTLSTGLVHLWSRSRRERWLKGASSGRLLRVVEVRPDCAMNSLLVLVEQTLPGACHTGHASCYYRAVHGAALEELSPPLFDPQDLYGDASARPLAELLGAYQWIHDEELIPESRTSRVLHDLGPEPLDRLRDEWGELLGVLRGTHRHTGPEEDVELESYQVLYWTCLCQVVAGLGRWVGLASASLDSGYGGQRDPEALLRDSYDATDAAARLVALWSALGSACRAGGIDPATVVGRDIRELRGREYMRAYFESSEP